MAEKNTILVIIIIVLLIFIWALLLLPKRCYRECCVRADANKKVTEIKENYSPGFTEIVQVTGSPDIAFNPDADYNREEVLM